MATTNAGKKARSPRPTMNPASGRIASEGMGGKRFSASMKRSPQEYPKDWITPATHSPKKGSHQARPQPDTATLRTTPDTRPTANATQQINTSTALPRPFISSDRRSSPVRRSVR